MTETVASMTLTLVTCSSCGIEFAMPEGYVRARHRDHRGWYCPNGHNQYFPAETEEEKLRKRLERAEASKIALRDQLGAAERSLTAQKGVTTRLKNRIANGVCPCCHRSFANLHRHMAGQHPDFVEETS